MTNDTAAARIFDRIQKLRRLATSSNVHEAAAAAAEAQRLMSEHHIREAELQSASGEIDETVTSADILGDTNSTTVRNWLVTLAIGVAKSNACEVSVRTKKGDSKIMIWGSKAHVDATNYLFQMLRKEINRLAAAHGFGRMQMSAMFSFKYGAAVEIADRMLAEKKATEARARAAAGFRSTGAAGALMVIDRQALAAKKAVDEHTRGGGKHNIQGPSNWAAYKAGQQAGATVDIGGRKNRLGERARQLGAVRS